MYIRKRYKLSNTPILLLQEEKKQLEVALPSKDAAILSTQYKNSEKQVDYYDLLHEAHLAINELITEEKTKVIKLNYSWNEDSSLNKCLLDSLLQLKYLQPTVYPVIFTSLPKENAYLVPFLNRVISMKNNTFEGKLDLNLCLNSKSIAVEETSALFKEIFRIRGLQGSRVDLNFLEKPKLTTQQMKKLFDPKYFITYP